jgi:acyl-coenzyme A synthetase/AMP-(fatty) acid ligase
MILDFLRDNFHRRADQEALVWCDESYTYGWLLDRWDDWRATLRKDGVSPGTVVCLHADFTPHAVALWLALVEAQCILVPVTTATFRQELLNIAQVERGYHADARDAFTCSWYTNRASHELYIQLRERGHPGLVLFSSGSTGKPKAAVHDVVPLLDKFRTPRSAYRTIPFLLFDHIGGINTMLYTLANGGCLITVADRSPDGVLQAVEKHRVQLLPTSPTFLNLLLISEAYKRHSLDSLELVTYGTEPMPESTLHRFHQLVPYVHLLQTYGLSEVGILQSKSKSSDSLWVKVGGRGFETRVVDGVLHIKAQSAMLGYLNAPSPFTADGWFNTGDRVEVDGEYLRFLGRQSDIINVGGEKVFPTEVESVIQEMDNVAAVSVYGEKNNITGQIVCARVTLIREEDAQAFTIRLKQFCQERLQRYKVPVKVILTSESQHNERFKTIRPHSQPAVDSSSGR